MRSRVPPAVLTRAPTTPITDSIRMASDTMRAPRILTVRLPLLAVTSPARGAEITRVPLTRLEVSPALERSWRRRNKVRQELLTDINIPSLGRPAAAFPLISSLLEPPYLLLSDNNKALLSILSLSLLWPLVSPFHKMLSSLHSYSLRVS